MILTGENRSTRRKTCRSATLSTTNPTWTDPGSNQGLCNERPATNRLSHGTASRMLRSLDWQLFTDVSGQLIGRIFKDQAVRGGNMESRNFYCLCKQGYGSEFRFYRLQIACSLRAMKMQFFWDVTSCRPLNCAICHYQQARRIIPEDLNLHPHCSYKLKFRLPKLFKHTSENQKLYGIGYPLDCVL